MEYRTYGWTSEASVVRNDGAFAVAAGRETGLQGGEDHWRENTWICWDASSSKSFTPRWLAGADGRSGSSMIGS